MIIASSITIGSILIFIGLNYISNEIERVAEQIRDLRQEAELLFQRALAGTEKALGPEHPHTAQSLNNLALLYRTQGRYKEPEVLYQRALAIREKALGPQHRQTAESLNNLAVLYRNEGRYEEAEPLFQRALAIYEKAPELDPVRPL